MIRPLMMVVLLALGSLGCEEGVLTRDEARAALNEASLSTQIYGLATAVSAPGLVVEGETPQVIAESMRSWWSSQVGCATTSGVGATVTVLFDEGGCQWADRTWTGEFTIEIKEASAGERRLAGAFTQVSTGILAVNGTMETAWNLGTGVGKLSHSLTWSDGSNGRVSEGECEVRMEESGSVTSLNGQRTWDGDTGEWSLTLEDTTIREADPVPESGIYQLQSPNMNALSLTFERQNEDRLSVKVSGPGNVYTFTVLTH